MELSQQKDEVEQLRQLLRHQALENDALKACVSRLEATEGYLASQLKNAQQEIDAARQAATRSATQARELAAELQEYETVVSRLLKVFDLPIPAKKTCGLESARGGIENGVDEVPEHGEDGNFAPVPEASAPQLETVESLRAELLAKTKQLKTTSAKYDQFMVASYTVEKSLVSKQTHLTRLIAELQAENMRLKAERSS